MGKAQSPKAQSPKDVKKRRAMNLDRLVKLTNEIKKNAFIQKDKPVEANSTLKVAEPPKSAVKLAADPKQAKLRAKKFANKMDSHIDGMREALHEHEKMVDTKIHLEKIAKQREIEAAQHAQWEAEQAKLQQLKVSA